MRFPSTIWTACPSHWRWCTTSRIRSSGAITAASPPWGIASCARHNRDTTFASARRPRVTTPSRSSWSRSCSQPIVSAVWFASSGLAVAVFRSVFSSRAGPNCCSAIHRFPAKHRISPPSTKSARAAYFTSAYATGEKSSFLRGESSAGSNFRPANAKLAIISIRGNLLIGRP